MVTWTADRLPCEQEDPYAAWDFARRAQAGAAPSDSAICPALIELLPAAYSDPVGAAEVEQLRESFAHVIARIKLPKGDADKLFASADELRLLEEKAAHLDRDPGLITKHYFRVVQVFVPEAAVYPRAESGFQDNAHFRITTLNRAIPAQFADTPAQAAPGPQAPLAPGACMIGVIDDSFAFLNDALTRQGESLFAQLCFQSRRAVVGDHVSVGAHLTGADISVAIAQKPAHSEAEIYASPLTTAGEDFTAIDLRSEAHQPLAFPLSHGTHVTDLAVQSFEAAVDGTGQGATLFGVAIPTEVTQDTSGQTLSSYLQIAIRQVFLWADQAAGVLAGGKAATPLVINFSYGFPAGPKDGTSPLNRILAELIGERNALGFPTALVVPMGNSANTQMVAAETAVTDSTPLEVEWVIDPADRTDNYLEIFARGADVTVTLQPPNHDAPALTLTLDGTSQNHLVPCFAESGALVAGAMEWALSATGDGKWDRHGFVAIGPTESLEHPGDVMPSGVWTLRITTKGRSEVVAMIQRDDAPGTYPTIGRQSYFDHADIPVETADVALVDGQFAGGPITKLHTSSVFSAIQSPFVYVVGAGMGEAGDLPQAPVSGSRYASYGPRPKDPAGPDLSALADRSDYFSGVYATGTYSGSRFAMSGASVAAPQFAGYLAANPGLIGQPPQPEIQDGKSREPVNNRFGIVLDMGV